MSLDISLLKIVHESTFDTIFDTTEQNNLISSSTVCCPDIHYSLCNSINLDNDFQSQKMSNIIFMITSFVFEISFYIEYFYLF